MSVKLEQYKVFNEAALTLSFSTAARNLFVSQSAVSQTISAMEKELRTQLFIRNPKGVTLTKEGELLHRHLNEALALISSAENHLTNFLILEEGELVIGASDTFSEHYLLPILADFHKLYPNVKIRLINRTSLEVTQLIKNGQLDLGFVNTAVNESSITFIEYLKIHDIFISKNKVNGPVSYKTLANLPLVVLENSSNSRMFLEQQFNKHHVHLTPGIELGQHDLIINAVIKDMGIGFVIREFSHKYLDSSLVYEIDITPKLPVRSVSYCFLNHKTLSASCNKFIELLEQKKDNSTLL